MVIEPDLSIPRYTATATQLDVLDLVRSGALPAYPPTAAPGTVELAMPEVLRTGSDLVELADLEGVPVARIAVTGTPSGAITHGEPTWLAERSARPFEELHRGPAACTARTTVVALRGPVADAEAQVAVTDAGARPLLLALASLDAEASPTALRTVGQAQRLAASHPGAEVAVAPAPAALGPAEVDAIIRSYAAGRPVHVLGSDELDRTGPGVVVFFTGLSGSGKSTLARSLRNRLLECGRRVTLLDGDLVRQHLSAGLGFSPADRDTNVRRIGWVAAEIAYHGGVAICSPIAPYEHTRHAVRQLVQGRGGRFVLVHVATPLTECERRDRKGLYARARRGEIPDFTGVTAPYQEPTDPDLRIDTTDRDVDSLLAELGTILDGSLR